MNRSAAVGVICDRTIAYPAHTDPATFVDPAAPLYGAVAEVLAAIGIPDLAGVVAPGDTVVIKPNWVSDRHPQGDDHLFGNITHGAVLAALADMAMRSAGPTGRVMIAEVTTQEACFRREAELSGMWPAAGLLAMRYGRPLPIYDLRSQVARIGPDGLVEGLREAPGLAADGMPFGDPLGYAFFDLGGRSEHARREGVASRLRVTDYSFSPSMKSAQAAETLDHHTEGRHVYCIPRTVLASDEEKVWRASVRTDDRTFGNVGYAALLDCLGIGDRQGGRSDHCQRCVAGVEEAVFGFDRAQRGVPLDQFDISAGEAALIINFVCPRLGAVDGPLKQARGKFKAGVGHDEDGEGVLGDAGVGSFEGDVFAGIFAVGGFAVIAEPPAKTAAVLGG